MQGDVALQMDGETKVGSGGEADRSASGCCCRFDGAADGGGVEGAAVAFRAEGGDFVAVLELCTAAVSGSATRAPTPAVAVFRKLRRGALGINGLFIPIPLLDERVRS
jgi:hypothetical protein